MVLQCLWVQQAWSVKSALIKHKILNRQLLSKDTICIMRCLASETCHVVPYRSGLMRDDTIYENPDVKEAVRRLPEPVYNDRMFRIKRALDLSMKQQILPKDQWTKYEEVEPCLFLRNNLIISIKFYPALLHNCFKKKLFK